MQALFWVQNCELQKLYAAEEAARQEVLKDIKRLELKFRQTALWETDLLSGDSFVSFKVAGPATALALESAPCVAVPQVVSQPTTSVSRNF